MLWPGMNNAMGRGEQLALASTLSGVILGLGLKQTRCLAQTAQRYSGPSGHQTVTWAIRVLTLEQRTISCLVAVGGAIVMRCEQT